MAGPAPLLADARVALEGPARSSSTSIACWSSRGGEDEEGERGGMFSFPLRSGRSGPSQAVVDGLPFIPSPSAAAPEVEPATARTVVGDEEDEAEGASLVERRVGVNVRGVGSDVEGWEAGGLLGGGREGSGAL